MLDDKRSKRTLRKTKGNPRYLLNDYLNITQVPRGTMAIIYNKDDYTSPANLRIPLGRVMKYCTYSNPYRNIKENKLKRSSEF